MIVEQLGDRPRGASDFQLPPLMNGGSADVKVALSRGRASCSVVNSRSNVHREIAQADDPG